MASSGDVTAQVGDSALYADAENRKVVTQAKILRSSMGFFASQGFDRTSISQIATRAGVSRSSIFWHFSDKATLFNETCRYFLVPFHESLDRAAAHQDPRQRIDERIQLYEHFVAEHLQTIRSFVSWVFTSQPHASSLREQLLAINLAFQRSLERDLTLLVNDPTAAKGLAATIVSILHGNTLLDLVNAPPDTEKPRADLLRELLQRISPERQVVKGE